MDKYYTIVVIPEKKNKERTFRIPSVSLRVIGFACLLFIILLGILVFDYLNIIKEVYKNRYLNLENKQLREQVQLFQMKLNSINQDVDRIKIFENKIKILTGVKRTNKTIPLQNNLNILDINEESSINTNINTLDNNKQDIQSQKEINIKKIQKNKNNQSNLLNELKEYKRNDLYKNLKSLYEQKIAHRIGFNSDATLAKRWAKLTWNSFKLANKFAYFDFNYKILSRQIASIETDFNEIDLKILDKRSFLNSTPTLLPTKGWITSYYGPRISPISKRLRMHEGIDIGAAINTDIVATADGKVTFAGIKQGFGYFVQIDHGYGIESCYAHANKVLVKTGDIIKRGNLIAKVGSSGNSTGPHVHYEIRINGTPVDPLYYILN